MPRFWVVAPICALGWAAACGGSEFKSDRSATAGTGGSADASAGTGANGGTLGSAGTGTGGRSGTGGSGGSGGASGSQGASGSLGASGALGSGGTFGSAGALGSAGMLGSSGTLGSGGTLGSAGALGSGGSGGSSNCGSALHGPRMAEVVTPNSRYCIDSTEVTNNDYLEFLASSNVLPQAAECAWNTSYTPGGAWPPDGKGGLPVAFVDWCDATAYCRWAGKRLCGKVGGGPSAPAELADAAKNQWFYACSAGGTKTYPYGASYDGLACNGSELGASGAVRAASLEKCEGGVSGVFDLSGNVFEWEDSCSGNSGANDICQARGGSYASSPVPLRCDSNQTFYRNAAGVNGPYLGFRCCSR